MAATERVELEGHIIDSLILAKVLDLIVAAGADYDLLDVDIGRGSADVSRATIDVTAADDDHLQSLLEELQVHGANRTEGTDAVLVPCESNGVLPEGFYATTNLATSIRLGGRWRPVENPEMDCALVADDDHVRTVPMHRVGRGDRVVVGSDGIRVEPLAKPRGASPFEFMASEVSSEKPKALLVDQVAGRVRACRERGEKVLAVGGPAVVHCGAGPDVASLVRDGWIDLLFTGNGFATHDIESNVLGTSLGVSVDAGLPVERGHSNHLRVINEIRRRGSIAAAVEDGYLKAGVMYECVRRPIPFVLAGSIRDDGPLPDVHTDVVEAVDLMRRHVDGVGVALMLASTLHAIAVGNVLPARVETFCIDINQAVVTKLSDRGSHQVLGIVTDVGPFLSDLAGALRG
ncbi:MAG TPA: TIGR00300 family protein [Acidimicrobiales bacterium]|jgi:lysine-ketoglutarate reductase/saccharopine dehydrogenase-like protein (TIGR00300 family)